MSATIGIEKSPTSVAINAVTNTLYVAGSGGQVTVINPSNGAVIARIPVQGAGAVAVNPTTNTIFATSVPYASSGPGTASILSGETNTVTESVRVGLDPAGITANPTTGQAYVANSGDGTVSVIGG